MSARKGSPEYQALRAAAMSVCKRILLRSELEPSQLEEPLAFEQDEGRNFRDYLNGKEVPQSWGRYAQIARLAYQKNWLIEEELHELGLKDIAKGDAPKDIEARRKKALRIFLDVRDNISSGRVPQKDCDGRWKVQPALLSESELQEKFEACMKAIEELGGFVTSKSYTRRPTKADLAEVQTEEAYESWCQDVLDRQWQAQEGADERAAREFLHELEIGKHDAQISPEIKSVIRDGLIRVLDGTVAMEEAFIEKARESYLEQSDAEEAARYPSQPPLPVWHPNNVKKLNLWFGGREYSDHPYRLLEESETSGYALRGRGSDDFSSFYALSPLDRARRQLAKERAREVKKNQQRRQRKIKAEQQSLDIRPSSTLPDKTKSRTRLKKDVVAGVVATAAPKIQIGTSRV